MKGDNIHMKEKVGIALVAHDGKKADMVGFVMKRLNFFNKENIVLYGTGTTSKHLKHAGVDKIVIFFRDPLGKHPHEVDISMLMRQCDVHNIPLATNYASAKMIISYIKKKLTK